MVPQLAEYIKLGFPVFITSSCGESGITTKMQLHDEDAIQAYNAGIRNCGDMTTESATVKLMNILGNTPEASLEEVREEMTGKNYAGEISITKYTEDY